MSNCIFCKIVEGEIPAELLYEDEYVLVFKDVQSQAPFHALVIPKQHIATINELEPENAGILAPMFLAAKHIAQAAGYQKQGYRTVMNCEEGGGQSVFHIHLHVLAGRRLTWPPG